MITKNEAQVIERCLNSVRRWIDYWVIVDTGSTDGTQTIINKCLKNLPGELIERPWVNFAHNRTEALTYAHNKSDYLLIMDADNTLEVIDDDEFPLLIHDAYNLEISYHRISYCIRQLIRNTLPWQYKGVLHEHLICAEKITESYLPGLRVIAHHDGARSRDSETYRKDAALLEEGLISEPGNSRYVFYLAQSYRDAGDHQRAIKNYHRRIEMAGWEEEIWYSMYQIAHLEKKLNIPWNKVIKSYLAAYEYKPDRAEPLFYIAMYFQQSSEYSQAYDYFTKALEIPKPRANCLFVEFDIYDYLLLLNFAVCCFHVREHTKAITINNHLLDNDLLPENLIGLVTQNRQLSLNAQTCES